MKDEIKEMPQIDATLEYSLEDFMEAYKIVDEDKVYSNGIEYVPIFRVKQWLDYNNITNLQEENEILKENAIHNDKVVDKAKWNEMIYKSRNEKAIEYIKKCRDYHKTYHNEDKMFPDELTSLIIILQGGDE